MAEEDKRNDLLKDIDIARGIENTLVGAIVFVGRYFRTFFRILVPSHVLEKTLIFNASYKPVARAEFTRPLSFLVVSGFIYLAFTLSTEGILIPIEPVINEFKWFIERFPRNFEELSLSKMSVFMVPFVMFVALYSLVCSVVSSWFGSVAGFKINLNIAAYIAGCCAVLISIMAVVEGPLWDLALRPNADWKNTLPLILGAAIYLLLQLWLVYRYLAMIRHAGESMSWIRTILSAAVSFVLFWVVTIVILRGLHPLLPKTH
jgi:hypothetical protein